MILLDGKNTALFYQEQVKTEIEAISAKGFRPPHLAAILVGSHPASTSYVSNKIKTCDKLGIKSSLVTLPDTISEDALIQEIDNLNDNDEVDGILVQLPLPNHINENRVIERVSFLKDVDGFHTTNLGLMTKGLDAIYPATPYGILLLLDYYKINPSGKHCVVIGRSNIVGTPISIMLSRNTQFGNATVTLTHSKTANLESITQMADIVIVAIGKANFLTANMIKPDAIVIDVGINSIPDASKSSGYKLCGDVDFNSVKDKASFLTPVPGGVGPMTITGLMMNTLKAYKRRKNIS